MVQGTAALGKEEEFSADYYRVRAAEMMEKAQNAPTKGIRVAYLNLAHRWAEEAGRLEAAARADWVPPSPAEEELPKDSP